MKSKVLKTTMLRCNSCNQELQGITIPAQFKGDKTQLNLDCIGWKCIDGRWYCACHAQEMLK